MDFTLHFRGVGVIVMKDNLITEILFPNGEKEPPEGKTEKVKNKRKHVRAVLMDHADETPAPRHEAGALVVGSDGTRYHRLAGRVVKIGQGERGAEFKAALPDELPNLAAAIDPAFQLKLLTDAERKIPARVATRFKFQGGTIDAELPTRGAWTIKGAHVEDDVGAKEYMTGVVCTVRDGGGDRLELGVWPLAEPDSTGTPPECIVLDATHNEVFFYNYDLGLPTVDDLTKQESDPDYHIDHDFKWVYRLFEPRNEDFNNRWQSWLGGKDFPAPELEEPFPTTKDGEPLVPVSTCLQTIWLDR